MNQSAKKDTTFQLLEDDGKNISAFERHIIKTCKAPEWELRKWLKKTLTRAGFTILEDQYKTDRVNRDKRYSSVHNMLAIRGENPRVCLVAHTDICRDHSSSISEFNTHWMRNEKEEKKEDSKKKPFLKEVFPVVKLCETNDGVRRIITDRDNKYQVGGDDRLGVAINTWIALNTGYDMGLFFPTDEEIGLKSSRVCEIQELKLFDLCMQTDRGNHSNQLVTKIHNEILCSYDTAVRLLDICYRIGFPRTPINGGSTDIYAIKQRNMCKEAINCTIGYHNSISDQADEYIDTVEAYEAMQFASEVVKDYYLEDTSIAQ